MLFILQTLNLQLSIMYKIYFMKKTLVIGASTNEDRYSYKCIEMLRDRGFETVALGRRQGVVKGITISTELESFDNIHTVCIYLSAKNLKDYEDYIISIKPQRVLFPPGTENEGFETRLTQNNIAHEKACPLVMLSAKTY